MLLLLIFNIPPPRYAVLPLHLRGERSYTIPLKNFTKKTLSCFIGRGCLSKSARRSPLKIGGVPPLAGRGYEEINETDTNHLVYLSPLRLVY